MLVSIKTWSLKLRLSSLIEDDVLTYRILLIAGATIYLLLGYLYFNEHLNSRSFLYINLGYGFLFMTMSVLSFVSQKVKSNLRSMVAIMAYMVMFQSIAEATNVNYEINSMIALIVTNFMCGLVFKNARQLYYFLLVCFAMVIVSLFMFREGELKKPVIAAIF